MIPNDPKELSNSECAQSAFIKLSLSDFYLDWCRKQKEKTRHHEIAVELIGMLEKGLYRVSPDVIFKIIGRLNIEYLL